MSDNAAIAAAIATRWTAAAGFTTPASQPDIVVATSQLPVGLPGVPALLVFPPDEPAIDTRSLLRLSMQAYSVRLYLVAEPSDPTDIVALYAWHNASQDRILTQVHLGLPTVVAHARITSIKPGIVAYEGNSYLGLDMVVSVKVSEAVTPVA